MGARSLRLTLRKQCHSPPQPSMQANSMILGFWGSRIAPNKSASVRLLILLFAVLFGQAVTAPAHAVQAQYLCTAPGVTPGSECVAIRISPWRYSGSTLGYSKVVPGYFNSEAAMQQAVWSEFMENPTSWCSMTFDHWHNDSQANASTMGIPTRYIDQIHWNVIAHTSDSPPCAASWSFYSTIAKTRTVDCPGGFTAIYEVGPPVVGPYCARPWGTEDLGAQYGSCDADPSGAVWKGNPCNVATRNKYEAEIDYEGSGELPLKFV